MVSVRVELEEFRFNTTKEHFGMQRYEKERPNTGGAEAAVNYARNTGKLPGSWAWFWWWSISRHEVRRALLGIDGPTAWCGDRNARLRRYIERLRTYPPCPLP